MARRKQSLCRVCGQEFSHDRYHPYQKVCLKFDCQLKRQRENIKRWRERNPYYFKVYSDSMSPAERRYREEQRHREKNVEYARNYRNKNPDKYRKYMRAYMREARVLIRQKVIF